MFQFIPFCFHAPRGKFAKVLDRKNYRLFSWLFSRSKLRFSELTEVVFFVVSKIHTIQATENQQCRWRSYHSPFWCWLPLSRPTSFVSTSEIGVSRVSRISRFNISIPIIIGDNHKASSFMFFFLTRLISSLPGENDDASTDVELNELLKRVETAINDEKVQKDVRLLTSDWKVSTTNITF